MNKKVIKIGIIVIAVVVIIGIILFAAKAKKEESSIETKKQITVSVFDKEANNIYTEDIKTEEEYLIEVLKEIEELNLVTEDSEYGKYIIEIMGIQQGDNYYWTYYIDSEYATTGVSNCNIEEGRVYSFRIESMDF